MADLFYSTYFFLSLFATGEYPMWNSMENFAPMELSEIHSVNRNDRLLCWLNNWICCYLKSPSIFAFLVICGGERVVKPSSATMPNPINFSTQLREEVKESASWAHFFSTRNSRLFFFSERNFNRSDKGIKLHVCMEIVNRKSRFVTVIWYATLAENCERFRRCVSTRKIKYVLN